MLGGLHSSIGPPNSPLNMTHIHTMSISHHKCPCKRTARSGSILSHHHMVFWTPRWRCRVWIVLLRAELEWP